MAATFRLPRRATLGRGERCDTFEISAIPPSRELRDKVQLVLGGRYQKRSKKRTNNFAFGGLIACGRYGCGMVGEIKGGRYVCCHCTGYRGKCAEPYIREEVLRRPRNSSAA